MNYPLTIREAIQRSAARDPEAVALLAPDRSALTYAGLEALVANTASALSQAGVHHGDRIALVLPNGPEMAAAFCAVASAAACAPLNPAYGPEELDFFLADLRASALVTDASAGSVAADVAGKRGIPVFWVTASTSQIAGDFVLAAQAGLSSRPPEFALATNVALMLHTSGTTSRPKLVPLSQANLCVSAANIQRALRLGPSDCCLNVMPLFHIHGLMAAVLASLMAGGSVVCAPGFHASRFFDWLREFEPTWYTAVPTMHQALLARAETLPREALRSRLRFIRSSSASLPPEVMGDLEALFQAPVIEAYGMTEASHQMASNPLPPGVRKPGSVGLPAGPEVAIMGDSGDLLAAGQTGEVVIRGGNVTAGYEANQEANHGAFRNGWFRTGDRGYLDSDGYLFLTGRLKEIINRGGEKISPREVDEVVLRHPAVRQALTFAVPHVQLGEDVGVAVVLKENVTAGAEEIREFAAARLAGFKVPRVVKFVDEISKGPTGKLQRIGLAGKLGIAPIDDRPRETHGVRTPPRDTVEQELAAIWREVLAVEEIGVEDDFISLGGTSLQLTELLNRARTIRGMRLSLAAFLETPTIAGMAEAIRRTLDSGTAGHAFPDGLVSIQPDGSGLPLFCAPGHDGNMVGFARLARLLGPDQPMFGIQFPAVGPRTRLEELANAVAATIRRQQPQGPYQLLGICFGGKIAYETACQLADSGERVALLCLVNCVNRRGGFMRRPVGRLAETLPRLAKGVHHHWQALAARTPREQLGYLQQRLVAVLHDDAALWAQRLRRALGAAARPSEDQQRLRQFTADRWRARPYPGDLILVADDRPRRGLQPSPQLGWEGLIAGRTPFRPVPDNHPRFWVDANIAFLASHLKPILLGNRVLPGGSPGD